MRPILWTAAAFAALTAPAMADDSYSRLIAERGLAGAEADLAARSDPTPSDLFALGGLRFLGAVETALQSRWAAGDLGLGELDQTLPVLRLPIPANPAPGPADPAMVRTILTALDADMAGTLEALDRIGDDDDVAVTISLADVWFDIDRDGVRSAGESLMDVAGLALNPWDDPLPTDITIRFDTADAAWLSAYAHLLSAVSNVILAYDPTDAITRTLAERAAMNTMAVVVDNEFDFFPTADLIAFADALTVIDRALNQEPDAARAQAAHAHLLDVVADNRVFWRRLSMERDNDLEWIPNKNQTSALPLAFPPETGTLWLKVLDDMERLLTGQTVLMFWALDEGQAGIDLSMVFEAPPRTSILGLFHGSDLVPYMREGRVADARALNDFDALVGGRTGLFAIFLN